MGAGGGLTADKVTTPARARALVEDSALSAVAFDGAAEASRVGGWSAAQALRSRPSDGVWGDVAGWSADRVHGSDASSRPSSAEASVHHDERERVHRAHRGGVDGHRRHRGGQVRPCRGLASRVHGEKLAAMPKESEK